MDNVMVASVGMVPSTKPGRSASYADMGEVTARAALTDAGVADDSVQQAYVGYVYGDSTSVQAPSYGVGLQHNLGLGGAYVVTRYEKVDA